MSFENDLEQFSLRWNNFNDNLKSGFHDLFRTEDFVDVTIAAEGKLIQAHKVVLSVCSPYFRDILKTNPCQHPVIVLKDVTHKELSGILQFMYLGEVSVQQEELVRFLRTAETLQIKGLTGNEEIESVNEKPKESAQNVVSNNAKLINENLLDKEMCVKKSTSDSGNDFVHGQCQALVKNEVEPTVYEQSESDELDVFPKTETIHLELSDAESDKISVENEGDHLNESFFKEPNDHMQVDVRQLPPPPPQPNFTGFTPGTVNGIQRLTNEPCLMPECNQGLPYFPLLTKNQGLCPICGRILQHKKNLQTHISDQHSGIFQSWPCQICQKVCKTWSALRVHTNRHHTKVGSSTVADVNR